MFFEVPMIGRSNARRPQQITLARAEEGQVLSAAEKRFGKDVLAILEEHYPSHFWNIFPDFRQGVANINIPILMGPTAKYTLLLHLIPGPSALRQAVIEAGGHILERFGIPRAGLDLGLAQFLDARANKALTRPNQAMPG